MSSLKNNLRDHLGSLRRQGRYRWLTEPLKWLQRRRDVFAQRFLLDSIIQDMRSVGPVEDLNELFDLASRGFYSAICPIQVRSEFIRLLELIRSEQPKRILEIGTANGGTLFMLSRVIHPDSLLVSVDLPGGKFGGGYPARFVPLFEAMPLPTQNLHLLREDSHVPV